MGLFYRYEAKEYFYGTVWPDVVASAGTWLFLILMLFTQKESTKSIMFLLAVFIFVGSRIYKAIDEKMRSYGNFETAVREDLERHKIRAIEKLGIDESQVHMIDPILVSGPYFDYHKLIENGTVKSKKRYILDAVVKILPFAYAIKLIRNQDFYEPHLVIKLDEERIKYSLVSQHLFFFSDEQIFIYEVNYDMVNGMIYEENTYDYFYRDVDCVETGAKSREIQVKNKKEIRMFEYFKVIVYSGTHTYAITEGQENILNNQVMAMRALLRERKLRE